MRTHGAVNANTQKTLVQSLKPFCTFSIKLVDFFPFEKAESVSSTLHSAVSNIPQLWRFLFFPFLAPCVEGTGERRLTTSSFYACSEQLLSFLTSCILVSFLSVFLDLSETFFTINIGSV